MPVQVEVAVDHSQHIFVVQAESVLELPVVGNSITCKVCQRENCKVTHVGIPTRISREVYLKNDNQKSLLE